MALAGPPVRARAQDGVTTGVWAWRSTYERGCHVRVATALRVRIGLPVVECGSLLCNVLTIVITKPNTRICFVRGYGGGPEQMMPPGTSRDMPWRRVIHL